MTYDDDDGRIDAPQEDGEMTRQEGDPISEEDARAVLTQTEFHGMRIPTVTMELIERRSRAEGLSHGEWVTYCVYRTLQLEDTRAGHNLLDLSEERLRAFIHEVQSWKHSGQLLDWAKRWHPTRKPRL